MQKNTAINVYKELSYIVCYDDLVYPTPLSIPELEVMLNTSKFLNLGADLIAVNQIKRIESKKVGEVENAILRIEDREIRQKVEREVKQRKMEWKRLNMEILKNVIAKFE